MVGAGIANLQAVALWRGVVLSNDLCAHIHARAPTHFHNIGLNSVLFRFKSLCLTYNRDFIWLYTLNCKDKLFISISISLCHIHLTDTCDFYLVHCFVL